MWCPECGGEYRKGFTECADCGVALVDVPPHLGVLEGGTLFPERSAPGQPAQVRIAGRDLRCHHCGHGHFRGRRAKLSSSLSTFLDLEWLDPSATILACTRCGYVHWFLPVEKGEDVAEPEAEVDDAGGAGTGPAQETVECLSCGNLMSPTAESCDACGWSYG